jgi:hypothetical protein
MKKEIEKERTKNARKLPFIGRRLSKTVVATSFDHRNEEEVAVFPNLSALFFVPALQSRFTSYLRTELWKANSQGNLPFLSILYYRSIPLFSLPCYFVLILSSSDYSSGTSTSSFLYLVFSFLPRLHVLHANNSYLCPRHFVACISLVFLSSHIFAVVCLHLLLLLSFLNLLLDFISLSFSIHTYPYHYFDSFFRIIYNSWSCCSQNVRLSPYFIAPPFSTLSCTYVMSIIFRSQRKAQNLFSSLLSLTQHVVVILYRRFCTPYRSQLQGSRSSRRKSKKIFFLEFLTLEDGADRLSRNVGTELPLYPA